MDKPGPAWVSRFRLAALFVLVTVGFALYRHAPVYIWNDSHGRFSGQDWVSGRSLSCQVVTAFATVQGAGYRPLSNLFYMLGLRYLVAGAGPTFPHLLLIGSLYGALAVALVAVARRFVRSEGAAYFAALLALASPAMAATTWVLLAGVQALVPLLVCVALLCYWRAQQPRGRWFFLGGLFALLLLGPWYREFLVVVPLLIGFLEWQRAGRPTPLLACAALGLAHALYPTALVKLLFLPDLPLRSVFALGNVAHALDTGFRWTAPAHFLPLFPPLLLLLSAAAGLLGSWERAHAFLRVETAAARRWRSLVTAVAFAGWLALVAGLLVTGGAGWLLPLALSLGVAAVGLQLDGLLPFWFLVAFLPILRVYTEHIHFLYAVVPASVIVAAAVEQLWRRAAALRGRAAWVRGGLAACVALGAADQAAALYGTHRVNRATYDGIAEVARWLTQHVPAGSAVVCNVIHGEEIKWHAGGHFENYWSIGAGVFDPTRVLEEPARLQDFLTRAGERCVYYLDVDFDYLPGKAAYHRHKYIHRMDVPREDLGVVHRTRAPYPFLDPLRYLVPREYVPFLGAPDLVNDFYCGPSPRRRPFTYQVGADYHLYRATGNDLRPKSVAAVHMAAEGFQGFNILGDGVGYYAIPQSDGAFDPVRFQNNGYSTQFRGLSVEAVKAQVEKWAAGAEKAMGLRPKTSACAIRLVLEGFHGFNVIGDGVGFYAIPQGDGAFDLVRFERNGYRVQFRGRTIEAVKTQVEVWAGGAKEPPAP